MTGILGQTDPHFAFDKFTSIAYVNRQFSTNLDKFKLDSNTSSTAGLEMYTFKLKSIILLILFVFSCGKRTAPRPRSIELNTTSYNGMFSMLDSALVGLQDFDNKLLDAFTINFADAGPYFDETQGPNWWSYYFLDSTWGDQSQPAHRTDYYWGYGDRYKNADPIISRKEAHEVIKKYFKIKPGIEEKVNEFTATHFQNFYIIGIHFRGTDKKAEAPRVPYELVYSKILEATKNRNDDFRIFVASDEENFVSYIEEKFPNKTIYVESSIRSTNGQPVHLNRTKNGFKVGEDALIDSLLLSKTNFLFRTSSNLSRWSTYFNPDLPVFELSKRHGI